MPNLQEIRTRLGGVLHSRVAKNSIALFGVQICRKVFPLVSVPYLARTLHPSGWGTVAFVLSLGEILALTIEFGFNLSATREMSQSRDSPTACGAIMSGVMGAQALLVCVCTALTLMLYQHIPLLSSNPRLVAAGLLYAVAQGCTPLWFFQGLEKMALAAGLEIASKSLGLVGLFVFVHSLEDGWKVVTLQATAAFISTATGIMLALRHLSYTPPTKLLIFGALRKGWPLFLFRSAESFYGVGNCFVLGLFAGPPVVGYFAVAEKISKATFGLLNPIREAMYPRLSYLVASSEHQAARLARWGIGIMTASGLVLTAILSVFAPAFIRLLAGPTFIRAVPVLRVMAWLPLVLSITYSVGLQWLLPLGRDATVNRIIMCGGIANLSLAFFLAPRAGELGMAWSVLAAELLVSCSMAWTVCRSTNLWSGVHGNHAYPAAAPGAREC